MILELSWIIHDLVRIPKFIFEVLMDFLGLIYCRLQTIHCLWRCAVNRNLSESNSKTKHFSSSVWRLEVIFTDQLRMFSYSIGSIVLWWRNCLHTSLMHCCTSRLVQLLAHPKPLAVACCRCSFERHALSPKFRGHQIKTVILDERSDFFALKSVSYSIRSISHASARRTTSVTTSFGTNPIGPTVVGWMTWEWTWQPQQHVALSMWAALMGCLVPTNGPWHVGQLVILFMDFVSFEFMLYHVAQNIYTETQTRDSWLRLVRSRWMCKTQTHAHTHVFPGAWHLNIFWRVYMLPGEAHHVYEIQHV